MRKTEKSVAEALGRAHAALLEDLRKLEETARKSSGQGAPELLARLGATRTHITEHFRFEEKNGYMHSVRSREPRLERTIQQMGDEHGELAHTMDAIVEEAGATTKLDETFWEKVRSWIERIRDHETRETALFQEAFNLDIGSED